MTNDNSYSLESENSRYVLAVLSGVFFMWGLITVLNSILMPDLQSVFELNYHEALLLNIAFFGTYFIVSIPAGKLINRVGFRQGLIIGIAVAATGCFVFYLAAENRSYSIFLLALFILGFGITILQTGANPYVALIGKNEFSAARLTLVQGFNSLGAFLAAVVGSSLLRMGEGKVSVETLDPEAFKAAKAHFVELPYLFLGAILVLLAIFLSVTFNRLPKIVTANMEPAIKESIPPRKYVLQFSHTVLGAIAIFMYVGAEVSIGNFLVVKSTVESSIEDMIPVYWGNAMIGRFIGTALLARITPGKLVGICALAASSLLAIFLVLSPDVASNNGIEMLLAVGLFNSILFPCIFTLAIDGLGKFSEEGASLQVMAIVGGAVIPFFVGDLIGDAFRSAFAIIVGCYLFIAFFGFRGSVYEKKL